MNDSFELILFAHDSKWEGILRDFMGIGKVYKINNRKNDVQQIVHYQYLAVILDVYAVILDVYGFIISHWLQLNRDHRFQWSLS